MHDYTFSLALIVGCSASCAFSLIRICSIAHLMLDEIRKEKK